VGPVDRARRWAVRNPGWATLLGTLFVVVSLAALSATLVAFEMREQRNTAKTNEARATKAERKIALDLGQSLVTQAEANRASTKVGRRYRTLELLSLAHDAFRLHDPENADREREIREHALSTLPFADFKPTGMVQVPGRLSVTLDGQFQKYAVAGQDLHVRVRRYDDQRELLVIPPPEAKATFADIGFQPSGKLFCANFRLENALNQGELWDLETNRRLFRTDGRLFAPSFHPTEPVICMMPALGGLVLLNARTGEQLQSLCLGDHIVDARYSPDGRFLAAAVYPATVRIFDSSTKSLVQEIPVGVVNAAMGWSHDGRLLALGDVDGGISVWDISKRRLQSKIAGHTAQAVLCDFEHGSYRLLTTSWDLVVRIWDGVNGKLLLEIPGAFACFSRDGRRLAVLDGDALRTGEFEPGDAVVGHPGMVGVERKLRGVCEVRRIDFSPDGSLMSTSAFEGVRLWDARTGRELAMLPTGHVEEARFHPNGNSIFTYGEVGIYRWPIARRVEGNGVETWAFGPPQELRDYHNVGYKQLDWIDGGSKLAANDNYFSRVEVLDPDAPHRGFDLNSESNRMTAPSTSSDSRWVATGVWGGADAFVWHVPSRALVAKLPLAQNGQLCRSAVAFNPDARSIVAKVSASAGSSVRCWRVPTWELLWSVSCEEDAAFGVPCFTPDGKLVAVPRTATSIALLDAQSGAVLADWKREDMLAPCPMRFTLDGRRLLIVDRSGTLEMWDLGRVRQHLAAMNLDWPAGVPIPNRSEDRPSKPMRITVQGELEHEAARKLEFVRAEIQKAATDPAAVDEAYRTGLRHCEGRFSQLAAASFRQVIAQDPKHSEAHHQLAKVYAFEMKWDEAFRSVSTHLLLKPDDREPLLLAASLANRLGRFEECVAFSTRLLALDANHFLARRERSAARIAIKNYGEARRDLDELIAREPYDLQLFLLRAACSDGLGESEQARSDRERAKRLSEAGRIPLPILPDLRQAPAAVK